MKDFPFLRRLPPVLCRHFSFSLYGDSYRACEQGALLLRPMDGGWKGVIEFNPSEIRGRVIRCVRRFQLFVECPA